MVWAVLSWPRDCWPPFSDFLNHWFSWSFVKWKLYFFLIWFKLAIINRRVISRPLFVSLLSVLCWKVITLYRILGYLVPRDFILRYDEGALRREFKLTHSWLDELSRTHCVLVPIGALHGRQMRRKKIFARRCSFLFLLLWLGLERILQEVLMWVEPSLRFDIDMGKCRHQATGTGEQIPVGCGRWVKRSSCLHLIKLIK